jgi:hypothetical protein
MKLVNPWLLIVVVLMGYASYADNPDRSEPRQKLNMDRLQNVVVTFPKASAQLSPADVARIQSAADFANANGGLGRAEIAAWADSALPNKGNLSKEERQLAADRIDTIRNVLRPQIKRIEYIRAYNMAENGNWLARMFHPHEAELKSAYAKKNDAAMLPEDLKTIRNEGAPMKAVIVLREFAH